MVQEYGRYFGLPKLRPRGGRLTGPNPASSCMDSSATSSNATWKDKKYKIFGYKGKQVRDNIHSHDVAGFILEFINQPRIRRSLQSGRRQR